MTFSSVGVAGGNDGSDGDDITAVLPFIYFPISLSFCFGGNSGNDNEENNINNNNNNNSSKNKNNLKKTSTITAMITTTKRNHGNVTAYPTTSN